MAAAVDRVAATRLPAPQRLTVLYDSRCDLCIRSQRWLRRQPAYVPLELLAADSPEAHRRYGALPDLGSDLMVVADTGQTWVGPPAFIMCLWALHDWREWSYRLSTPSMAPLAKRFFLNVSRHRDMISSVLGGPRLARSEPACADDGCTPDPAWHPPG